MNQPTDKSAKTNGTSRRTFIASTAAAAGAAALPAHSYAQVGGSSELKVSLIGCGGRGTGAAAQTLRNEGVKLVAMADAFRDRLDGSYNQLQKDNAAKMDVPEERKFVGFDAYKHAIEVADVVLLTTPPGFRPIHFEAAVKAGKHVFMEKPVGTDSPGIRKVLETARLADEKGLKVVVGLQRHYQNSYLETLKQLQAGAIGEITSAQCYWNGAGVWTRDRKPDMTEMQYQMTNWYYFAWLCGDHIAEQHVHNIDVINWFKSIDEGALREVAPGVKLAHPVSAQGMGGREVRTGKEHGHIFDHHYVEFTYADGSVMNSQCRHIKGCWNRVDEMVQGTKGSAGPGWVKGLKGENVWRHRGKGDPNPYDVEHEKLYEAIRNNTPLNNAYYGATSTFSSILGRYCTYSGKQLNWDDALASNIALVPSEFAWDAEPPILPDENGFYPVAVPGEFKAI